MALCTDINECFMENECPPEAQCRNEIGSYTCLCPEGFVNDDINGCVGRQLLTVRHLLACSSRPYHAVLIRPLPVAVQTSTSAPRWASSVQAAIAPSASTQSARSSADVVRATTAIRPRFSAASVGALLRLISIAPFFKSQIHSIACTRRHQRVPHTGVLLRTERRLQQHRRQFRMHLL